ncbi:MAG: hypothetical protein HRT89_03500 [Lentisphaeria bacterium]|nr:hypothetical protein [Lentisphaeria bacterium]NQZ67115.1 hypothetical protein [Lentisphaeria bacterium]
MKTVYGLCIILSMINSVALAKDSGKKKKADPKKVRKAWLKRIHIINNMDIHFQKTYKFSTKPNSFYGIDKAIRVNPKTKKGFANKFLYVQVDVSMAVRMIKHKKKVTPKGMLSYAKIFYYSKEVKILFPEEYKEAEKMYKKFLGK